jgi:hypothetical protein
MDDALKRKMAHEFSGIEQTTFWNEYQKAIKGHRGYHSQTLEKSAVGVEISRAQGSVFAIDKVLRFPSELTGRDNVPEKDKE